MGIKFQIRLNIGGNVVLHLGRSGENEAALKQSTIHLTREIKRAEMRKNGKKEGQVRPNGLGRVGK